MYCHYCAFFCPLNDYCDTVENLVGGLRQGWKWVWWPRQSGSFVSLFRGSSGSHPQTKLFGCDPDITCSLENSVGIWYVSEWTVGLLNTPKYHWCEPAYYLKPFWSTWCPKISSSRSLCLQETGPVACQEWRNPWYHSISKIFHVMLHYF